MSEHSTPDYRDTDPGYRVPRLLMPVGFTTTRTDAPHGNGYAVTYSDGLTVAYVGALYRVGKRWAAFTAVYGERDRRLLPSAGFSNTYASKQDAYLAVTRASEAAA